MWPRRFGPPASSARSARWSRCFATAPNVISARRCSPKTASEQVLDCQCSPDVEQMRTAGSVTRSGPEIQPVEVGVDPSDLQGAAPHRGALRSAGLRPVAGLDCRPIEVGLDPGEWCAAAPHGGARHPYPLSHAISKRSASRRLSKPPEITFLCAVF